MFHTRTSVHVLQQQNGRTGHRIYLEAQAGYLENLLCGLEVSKNRLGEKIIGADKDPFRVLEVLLLSPQFLCENWDLNFIKISLRGFNSGSLNTTSDSPSDACMD